MKKVISIILIFVMALSVSAFDFVYADSDIKVNINGNIQNYDVMPVIENGRTLVPMRAIFEALGATVQWDDTTKTVTGTKGETKVSLQIGNTSAKVNQTEVTLDVPAKIISDRTMVPVRFISESLGCEVNWDDLTKTVIIKSDSKKLAELKSTLHRNIPEEFEKSKDMKDMFYFAPDAIDEQEKQYAEVKKLGTVVCDEEEFLNAMSHTQGPEFGKYEIIDVQGQPFKKALRLTCTSVPEKDSKLIAKTKATPETTPGGGVAKEDQMLLAYRFRLIDGGREGKATVKVQIQHPETYKKALFAEATAGKEWKIVYMPFKGVKDATDIGIRFGYAEQVVELGGIEIINFGPDFDVSTLPYTSEEYEELKLDASWREDAYKRIEQLRKGDFTVVVKDKDGNVIPNAEVEFDMFEHEFQFGNAYKGAIISDENYIKYHNMNFNAGVNEHVLKWAPFENKPESARSHVDAAKNAGVKYLRGHAIFWEKDFGSDGKTYLTPEYMFTDEVLKNKEVFDEKCRQHVESICTAFKVEMNDWDVVNEIISDKKFREVWGSGIFKQWFDWAREYAGEDCVLYYNETGDVWTEEYHTLIQEMLDNGVDIDALGIQSHYDGGLKMPSELMGLYDSLEKYGLRLKVTEFSCSIADAKLQGNYMRDVMITCFADELMDGFLMWGFYDGNNFKAYSPMYDTNWNIKPAGKVYQDLVYNKWWTKDAKTTTDANGKATVRGFYGDYDVTVNANGKTYTDMVAFHKGYDNVLEIVIE